MQNSSPPSQEDKNKAEPHKTLHPIIMRTSNNTHGPATSSATSVLLPRWPPRPIHCSPLHATIPSETEADRTLHRALGSPGEPSGTHPTRGCETFPSSARSSGRHGYTQPPDDEDDILPLPTTNRRYSGRHYINSSDARVGSIYTKNYIKPDPALEVKNIQI